MAVPVVNGDATFPRKQNCLMRSLLPFPAWRHAACALLAHGWRSAASIATPKRAVHRAGSGRLPAAAPCPGRGLAQGHSTGSSRSTRTRFVRTACSPVRGGISGPGISGAAASARRRQGRIGWPSWWQAESRFPRTWRTSAGCAGTNAPGSQCAVPLHMFLTSRSVALASCCTQRRDQCNRVLPRHPSPGGTGTLHRRDRRCSGVTWLMPLLLAARHRRSKRACHRG